MPTPPSPDSASAGLAAPSIGALGGSSLDVLPYPPINLAGWTIIGSDDSDLGDDIDEPILVGPQGTHIETWREGYPYESRLSRREYEDIKRSLQIELLKLQSW